MRVDTLFCKASSRRRDQLGRERVVFMTLSKSACRVSNLFGIGAMMSRDAKAELTVSVSR